MATGESSSRLSDLEFSNTVRVSRPNHPTIELDLEQVTLRSISTMFSVSSRLTRRTY